MYTFHMLATCDCNWGESESQNRQPELKAKANAKTTLHTLAQGAHCCYPASVLPASAARHCRLLPATADVVVAAAVVGFVILVQCRLFCK